MPAITPDLRERARGCLVGAAIGDAFGMPLEGAPRQDVNFQVRQLRQGRLPAGHFTAATGALLSVGENLVAPQPLAMEEVAGRLNVWQKLRPSSHSGAEQQGFFARLFKSRPVETKPVWTEYEYGTAEAYPLTRVLPIALANVHDRDTCLFQAREMIRLTHPHPACVGGGAFVAIVIWHLLRGMAPREAVKESLKVCNDLPAELAQNLRVAPASRRDQLAGTDLVEPTLVNATWTLITTAFYAEAVTRVANLGGNASTAAALIGAMAGAAYRQSGIPADWRALVHGNWPPAHGSRLWRQQDLIDLADRLVAV